MWIHLDGRLVPAAEARVSVFDHGLLYGDGVFEGIRVYDGNIFRLREHLDRLFESARTLMIEIPRSLGELEADTAEAVAANGLRDAYIRLLVTRGVGDLGIDPASCPKPSVVIIVTGVRFYPAAVYENGMGIVTASTRRVPPDSLDPRIKTLNYVNNILAKLEARRAGVPEALMLNHHGRVAEGTADNVFMVKHGRLKTPCVMEGALPGITRGAVLELARAAGVSTEEGAIGLHDLYNADEMFLTGTGAELVPVIALDGRRIGAGEPGPMTRRLAAAFMALRVRDGFKVEYGLERERAAASGE